MSKAFTDEVTPDPKPSTLNPSSKTKGTLNRLMVHSTLVGIFVAQGI